MSDEDYPYHIKNWKTAKEYPSLTKMNGVALAWEFLRRNPDYQKDFDDFSKVALGIKYNHVRRKIMDKWFSNPPTKSFVPNPLDDKPKGLGLFLDKYPRCYQTITNNPTKYPNDKVVVFDRVRELFRLARKAEPEEILNRSINNTLSRTIITALFTAITMAALYFFGGPAVHGFAITMLIGILVGTLSSIFVASPILLWLGVSKQDLMPKTKENPELARRP